MRLLTILPITAALYRTIVAASIPGVSTQKPLQAVLEPFEHDYTTISRHDESFDYVREHLRSARIIPDVIDDFPSAFLPSIHYSSRKDFIDLGDTVNVRDVEIRPDLIKIFPLSSSKSLSPDLTYTLVLTDPDATSRADPDKGQFCHWILSNITFPLDLLRLHSKYETPIEIDLSLEAFHTGGNAAGYVELESYYPPQPPPGSGYHRYVFVLLAQETNHIQTTTVPVAPVDRIHWGYQKEGTGVREWASENDLTVLGATYFSTQDPTLA